MAGPSRYNTSDDSSVQEGVLQNTFNITDKTELGDTETVLLADAYQHFFELLEEEKLVLNAHLLYTIHEYFLGPLYDWAGQLRTVDISKEGVLFASVRFLEESMENFDSLIEKNIPTIEDSKNDVAKKVACIHNEFNAIHPFREGNGRTIRLFLDLLVAQSGYDYIHYGESESAYINACIAGMHGDQESMEKLIFKGLKKKRTS